jgi:hypothetical protein
MGVLVPVRRRRSKRHAVHFECQVVKEHGFSLLGVRAVDLSTEGMLVLTDRRVLTGEDVLVSFRAPGQRRWFDAEATVARVLHGRRWGDVGRAIGLRFSKMDSVTRSYVKAGLAYLPPTIPARDARIDYAETVTRILLGVD